MRTRTRCVLRVHPSNFRMLGFAERVEIEALCGLGRPVVDDVGSGNLADDVAAFADEPPVRRSVRAGAALVCFSGDKLLGGPQAGLLVGSEAAVAAARSHPLARALRIDKLSLAALEATLRLYRDPARARAEIPVLAMLDATEEELAARAGALDDALRAGGSRRRSSARSRRSAAARCRCSSSRARWSSSTRRRCRPTSWHGGCATCGSCTPRLRSPWSRGSNGNGWCSIPAR